MTAESLHSADADATSAAMPDVCLRCGYDLRGIADEQPCPECGLLAQRSRRPTDELFDARPRWLASISRGIWLILLAIFLSFFTLPLLALLDEWGAYWVFLNDLPAWVVTIMPLLWIVLPAVVFIAGIFCVTKPEGYAPADRADARRRRRLRLLAFIPLLLLILQYAFARLGTGLVATRDIEARDFAQLLASGCLIFIFVPLPILLAHQLRSLAARARSEHLMEHSVIVGYGVSAALLYMLLTVAFFISKRNEDPYWGSTSNASLVLVLILTTSISLFLLWTLYVLVRFAIAFRRASRLLRSRWQRDDRALAEPIPPAQPQV